MNKPKDKYRLTNWSAYNAGLKQRGSLTLWISEDVAGSWHYDGVVKRGGQFEYSDTCIRVLLTLKVTFRLAFRQLEGFAGSIFQLMGIDLRVRKHGYSKRRTWRKLHLAADEKTGQILAQVLTDSKTDDASVLPTLIVYFGANLPT